MVLGNPWSEEYQVEYLDMNHRVFDRIDAVVGEHVWNFADFTTTSESCGSAATRKASSPAIDSPRLPPTPALARGPLISGPRSIEEGTHIHVDLVRILRRNITRI